MRTSTNVRWATMIAAAIALAGFARIARSQAPARDSRVAAIEGVIHYRRLFLNDTSSFELCSLSRALRPLDPPFGLTPFAFAVVDTASWCRSKTDRVWPAHSAPVGIHKIIIAPDSTGTVVLAIYRGEYGHTETYSLRGGTASGNWTVTGVALSAGSYSEIRSPDDADVTRHERPKGKPKP